MAHFEAQNLFGWFLLMGNRHRIQYRHGNCATVRFRQRFWELSGKAVSGTIGLHAVNMKC